MAAKNYQRDDFLNQNFFSFHEFENALKIFQIQQHTQFVKSNSEKLSSTDKLQEQFVYKSVKYVCKQGASRHKSTAKASDENGKKTRPYQKSYKVSRSVLKSNK